MIQNVLDCGIFSKGLTFAPGLNLRTILKDNEPWFVAKDACSVLDLKGYASFHTKLLEAKDVEVLVRSKAAEPETLAAFDRCAPSATIISESGLYSLILKSRKPAARAFKKWVTSVVLPAIRKDGAYIKGEEEGATGPRGCPGKSRGHVVS